MLGRRPQALDTSSMHNIEITVLSLDCKCGRDMSLMRHFQQKKKACISVDGERAAQVETSTEFTVYGSRESQERAFIYVLAKTIAE